VTFNKGTLSNGTLTVSPTDLATLQLTVPDSDQGNFTLTVTATASDGSDSASTSGTITVTVTGVAEAPTLTVGATAKGGEDQPISLSVNTALVNDGAGGDPDETLSTTVSGVPNGVVLSDGGSNTKTSNGAPIDVSGWNLAGLQVTAGDATEGFTLTVTSTADDGGNTASTSGTITVTVKEQAEAPTLTLSNATVTEGSSVTLSITDVLSDPTDDSALTQVTITGVPKGVTFNHGTLSGSTLTLYPAGLAGLQMTVPEGDNFTLTVNATTNDGGVGGHTSGTITVTVNGVAEAPSLKLSNATVTEGSSVTLSISDVLSEADADSTLGKRSKNPWIASLRSAVGAPGCLSAKPWLEFDRTLSLTIGRFPFR
jgi:hypothetical protein